MSMVQKLKSLDSKPTKDFLKEFNKLVPDKSHTEQNRILRKMLYLKQLQFEENEKNRKIIGKKLNAISGSYPFKYKRTQLAGGELSVPEEKKKLKSVLENNFFEKFLEENQSKPKYQLKNELYMP